MPTLAVIAPDEFGLDQLVIEPGLAVPSAVRFDGEGLPQDVAGLLIYAPDGMRLTSENVSKAVEDALMADIPILACAAGMNHLNVVLGGEEAKETTTHTLGDNNDSRKRKTVFLALGTKVSSTIGGSGWVGVECDHEMGVPHARLAPGLMMSAMADDRVVEAFEMPGHRWVIGVQWDLLGANRLPRGFDAIWLAFLERVTGE